jgi:hypothetical protein
MPTSAELRGYCAPGACSHTNCVALRRVMSQRWLLSAHLANVIGIHDGVAIDSLELRLGQSMHRSASVAGIAGLVRQWREGTQCSCRERSPKLGFRVQSRSGRAALAGSPERRRQATSREPDRLRLFPVAWARDAMRSELPTKGAENLNSGVFNQQPSTHTALWTGISETGLRRSVRGTPRVPPVFGETRGAKPFLRNVFPALR